MLISVTLTKMAFERPVWVVRTWLSRAGIARYVSMRPVLPISIVLGILLAAAPGCQEYQHSQYAGLEEIQKETTFAIVIPTYLPEGIDHFSIIKAGLPLTANHSGVTMAFARPGETIVEIVSITETDQPWGNLENVGQPYTFRTVKETRVATLEGNFFVVPSSRGPQKAPGVIAEWDHRGVHFAMTTVGVFWPEVEKIVGSMIESP